MKDFGISYLSPSDRNSIAAAAEPLHLLQLEPSVAHAGRRSTAGAWRARRTRVANSPALVVVVAALGGVEFELAGVQQLLRLRLACGVDGRLSRLAGADEVVEGGHEVRMLQRCAPSAVRGRAAGAALEEGGAFELAVTYCFGDCTRLVSGTQVASRGSSGAKHEVLTVAEVLGTPAAGLRQWLEVTFGGALLAGRRGGACGAHGGGVLFV